MNFHISLISFLKIHKLYSLGKGTSRLAGEKKPWGPGEFAGLSGITGAASVCCFLLSHKGDKEKEKHRPTDFLGPPREEMKICRNSVFSLFHRFTTIYEKASECNLFGLELSLSPTRKGNSCCKPRENAQAREFP